MKNARRFNERITIGVVPDDDDLVQLKELGFRTLVDLRDEDERFGGRAERRIVALGLTYFSIPSPGTPSS